MATDNNIKNFTAADIEKYHKGQLSASAMHDLEKASLDDPFLADALEGFTVGGVNVATDIDELKKRLGDKVETGKIIAMNTGGKSSFPWLRVTAMVILIAGAGILAKQFVFTSKTKNIAQADTKKDETAKAFDTATGITSTTASSENKPTTATELTKKENGKTPTTTEKTTAPAGRISKDATGKGAITTGKTTGDVTVTSTNGTKPVATAPVKNSDEQKKFLKSDDKNADKKEIAGEETKNKAANTGKQQPHNDGVKDQVLQRSEDIKSNKAFTATSRQVNEQYNRNNTTNIFRGRVTDASNVGVPFANVTNAQDNNAGTYTDAKGYFNLTYPDSVLNVQVKSIGFENSNVQLRTSVANNQVVMQDDRKSLSEVVISNSKPNAAARSHDANMKLEEPEPADGWDNYDTYLANNLNAPEEIKTKPNGRGQVQVSFEVDKNGEPFNIKVEKSLCAKCDDEAVRLIKEGPKWKRNAKKGRTTITVSFSNFLQ